MSNQWLTSPVENDRVTVVFEMNFIKVQTLQFKILSLFSRCEWMFVLSDHKLHTSHNVQLWCLLHSPYYKNNEPMNNDRFQSIIKFEKDIL